jgi:hypothetical protein
MLSLEPCLDGLFEQQPLPNGTIDNFKPFRWFVPNPQNSMKMSDVEHRGFSLDPRFTLPCVVAVIRWQLEMDRDQLRARKRWSLGPTATPD